MIDFTDCQQDIHRVYGGYANSCISEHLGCKIFRSMGIEAQDTLLGTYRLDDGREKLESLD